MAKTSKPEFTFSLERIAFNENYTPAKTTRATTNFANLARGGDRENNLRKALRMINSRFNALTHWDNPEGVRYAVNVEIISVRLNHAQIDTLADFPIIEMLNTQILDRQQNKIIAGMTGNSFSSYVRDYDFSVALPAFLKEHNGAEKPDDFGVLHGNIFKKFLQSPCYQENFAKAPVICLSVSTSQTYEKTGLIHPILGQEYRQEAPSLTDDYFAKMGCQRRFFMPKGSVAPLAFYFFGDLLADYTALELISAISTMETFQKIYRPEIYNANAAAADIYRPSLRHSDYSLTQITYDRAERRDLAQMQGLLARDHLITPHQTRLSQWSAA